MIFLLLILLYCLSIDFWFRIYSPFVVVRYLGFSSPCSSFSSSLYSSSYLLYVLINIIKQVRMLWYFGEYVRKWVDEIGHISNTCLRPSQQNCLCMVDFLLVFRIHKLIITFVWLLMYSKSIDSFELCILF